VVTIDVGGAPTVSFLESGEIFAKATIFAPDLTSNASTESNSVSKIKRCPVPAATEKGLSTVLWECGGVLSARAIEDKCVQKVMAFIAPKIIGGGKARSPVGDLGLERMTEALSLTDITIKSIESDILIEGYLQN
jgi:riboflavin biosynthesis pyrimidine reductase